MLPLRRLALPVVPVLLAAGSLAVASPASADVTGRTSTDDAVLYSHCQQHPISYEVTPSPGTTLWRLEIQVFDPEGAVSEGTVLSSAAGAPTSGTVVHTFCGSEDPGTYTVRASGFYEGVPLVQVPFSLPDTTFEVRRAETRTELVRKPLGHGRYRLTTGVREQTERGFTRSDGVSLLIERLVHGQWQKVRGTSLTTVHGRATTVVRGRPGTALRAVVPTRSNYAGSASRPVRL